MKESYNPFEPLNPGDVDTRAEEMDMGQLEEIHYTAPETEDNPLPEPEQKKWKEDPDTSINNRGKEE